MYETNCKRKSNVYLKSIITRRYNIHVIRQVYLPFRAPLGVSCVLMCCGGSNEWVGGSGSATNKDTVPARGFILTFMCKCALDPQLSKMR